MTSQTSLNKRFLYKNAWIFSFVSSFGTGVLLINVIALVVLMFIPFVSIDSLVLEKMNDSELLYSLLSETKSNIMSFILFVQAMVTAVMMFGFMSNKRGSTAYLSLPVNRAGLFWTRYIAGIIMLIIPSIISMSWLLYANIRVFGYSSPLIQAFIVITASVIVILLSVYSITTLICLLAGTIPEGLAFSVIMIFSPVLLLSGLTSIFAMLLNGSAYGQWLTYMSILPSNLTYYASPYMPVFSSVVFISRFGECAYLAEEFDIPFWGDNLNGAVILVIWFCLSILISCLAYKAFKHYKAEKSGTLGANRALNFCGTFIAVFFIFSLFTDMYESVSAAGAILISVLSSLAAYFVCRFLLTLNIRRTFAIESLKEFGVMAAGILCVCVVCLTGMFGFSSYQPKLDEIESASITYTGAPDYIMKNGADVSNNYYITSGDSLEQDIFFRDFEQFEYTSENDINTVLELHKLMIDCGTGIFDPKKQNIENKDSDRLKTFIHVQYKLKNGKTIDRLYKSITAQTAMEMTKLDETDLIRSLVNRFIETAAGQDELSILISDCLFKNTIDLDANYKKELFEALKKDIDNLALEEKYYPDSAAKAIIVFPRLVYDEETQAVSSSVVVMGDFIVGNSVAMNPGDSEYYKYVMMNGNTGTMRLYITEGYVNTLAFLAEKDILSSIDDALNAENIAELYVERYKINPNYKSQPFYFRSYIPGQLKLNDGTLEIEKDQYQSILNLSRSNYCIAEGGYLVKMLVKAEDDYATLFVMFLPESDAPDYVKIHQFK